jgi:hypothetical protein
MLKRGTLGATWQMQVLVALLDAGVLLFLLEGQVFHVVRWSGWFSEALLCYNSLLLNASSHSSRIRSLLKQAKQPR